MKVTFKKIIIVNYQQDWKGNLTGTISTDI